MLAVASGLLCLDVIGRVRGLVGLRAPAFTLPQFYPVDTQTQSDADSVLGKYLKRGLLVGVATALALVIGGRVLVPACPWLGTIAASAILLAYAALAAVGPAQLSKRHPVILRTATVFGLLAGAVFAAEIIIEYALLPANNSSYGLVEFGTVFFLYFASALVAGFRSRSVVSACWTSVSCAFIASLLWVIAVLAVFYAFRGSPRQELVLRAEGNYEDFARSGMRDFDAFIMEDFMGATFFHLSLGLVVAAVLGAFGGLLGKVAARFQK